MIIRRLSAPSKAIGYLHSGLYRSSDQLAKYIWLYQAAIEKNCHTKQFIYIYVIIWKNSFF